MENDQDQTDQTDQTDQDQTTESDSPATEPGKRKCVCGDAAALHFLGGGLALSLVYCLGPSRLPERTGSGRCDCKKLTFWSSLG